MDYKELKKQTLNRSRRIIYDNDGCDVIYYSKEATEESLLESMMIPLLNSQVDSVFCNSVNSGFGQFTHPTNVGSFFTYREGEYENCITEELANKGTDHLKIKIDFCRKHNLEVFWQLRMNDTHDGSDSWYGPVGFMNNELKNAHPEYLMSTPDNKPKCGAWSAVDFGIEEVRDLCFKFVEEVLDNYDFDGISLDFFRHPVFFKSTSEGLKASEQDIEQMTSLIKKIANLLEKRGREAGKGMLLAVRVPDSVEYSKAIGLDIVDWLKSGYVDILITTSYIHLNDWEYSVKLGHEYGAKVYPSLDEVRINEDKARLSRQTVECYRARAMNALSAGADGIFLFNYKSRDIAAFGENSSDIYTEIGSEASLVNKNKTYFASFIGDGRIAGRGYPHKDYTKKSILSPDDPITIEASKVCIISFRIGEPVDEKNMMKSVLYLRFKEKTEKNDISAELNGGKLTYIEIDGDTLKFKIKNADIYQGINELKIKANDKANKIITLIDIQVDVKYS